MTDKVVVLVLDIDDPRHGEINVVEDYREAAGIMESLLEAGFALDRIRVFHGNEIEPAVTYRATVLLDAPVTDRNGDLADVVR